VRGACALRPHLRGISHRIRVRSIVGRFLEHSRIFYFENGGEPDVYLGSADWMPRNLYERVEVMFPLKHPALQKRVFEELLKNYLRDNAKARMLHANGSYVRAGHDDMGQAAARNGVRFNVQEFFVTLAANSQAELVNPARAATAA
jgi:polyphosphate kinase